MKAEIIRTLHIELTETEAFALKMFMDVSIKEVKNMSESYLAPAKNLANELNKPRK